MSKPTIRGGKPMTNFNELRAEILDEFNTVLRLAPSDYTENCTNIVMSIVDNYITANYIPRQSYIELLNLFGTPTCESLHHPKKYQHRAVEDCPVVERITELTKGATK